MKRTTLHILFVLLTTTQLKSQNVLLNNWSIHEHQDTNIFLSVTAIDQMRYSNIGIGKWANGSIKNEKTTVFASDIRNRELLRISYSKPDFEIGYVTSQLSMHHKVIDGYAFNGLMSGQYPANDTLNIQSLGSVHRSTVCHSLEFTKKSEKTILQLAINGSQINSLRQINTGGQFINNEFVYSGKYLTEDVSYNRQLDYLGSPEDALSSNLNWSDSVRITTIQQLPLLPSLNFHIIHRPTEFTEFQFRIEGVGFLSKLPVQIAYDSTSFKLPSGEIPNYETFTEELPVVLNSDYEYQRFGRRVINDTALSYRALPLRIMGAYKVQIEPLTSIVLNFSYTKYDPYSLVMVNAMVQRKYNEDLLLQGGLCTAINGSKVQSNLSFGIKTRLANKITLFAHTHALLSLPYAGSTLVPAWINRYQINATLQYQLL